MSRVARKNLSQGLDTNGTVQPQKMARDLKFRIKGDGLYYLYSENKGADQLRGSYDKNVYALKFVKFTLIDSQGGFLF